VRLTDAPIVEPDTLPDYVHLLVSCDPQYGIHRLVNQIKGRLSRLLRDEFPHLPSGPAADSVGQLFVATVGGATLEVVKRYVENQRNV
jgi:putative transposase